MLTKSLPMIVARLFLWFMALRAMTRLLTMATGIGLIIFVLTPGSAEEKATAICNRSKAVIQDYGPTFISYAKESAERLIADIRDLTKPTKQGDTER